MVLQLRESTVYRVYGSPTPGKRLRARFRPRFLGYRSFEDLPAGINLKGTPQPADRVRFLTDRTWIDEHGSQQFEHEIIDTMLDMINQAKRLIVLDQFLFNDLLTSGRPVRNICDELTTALVNKQQHIPDIQIFFVTDPCNTLYGGLRSVFFDRLIDAGIKVITTDLDQLRDSSPVYSLFWRIFIRPLGNTTGGVVPNPFGRTPVTLRSLLHIPNMKANHRKTLIADSGHDWVGLVSTANPHNASYLNQNVALQFNGPAVADLLRSELAVICMSVGRSPQVCHAVTPLPVADVTTQVSIHSEGAIKEQLLTLIADTASGDHIDLILFYLSDRAVVKALTEAVKRGVDVRVVLDPSKDAFGWRKIGIPNRPVASRLHRHGINVRWADTRGEQCHTKMALITTVGAHDVPATSRLLLGSANYTRRNLDNFNLECNALLTGPSHTPALAEASALFEEVWSNRHNRGHTVDYAAYEERSLVRHMIYWCMEVTGISTF